MTVTLADLSERYHSEAVGQLRVRLVKALRGVQHQGEAIAKGNATRSPKVRRGTLRRSIRGDVEQEGSALILSISAGKDGPAERYAATQEKGETILPRNGRFLAIPMGPALTGSGVARYQSPRDVAGLVFIPIHGGAAGILVRDIPGRGKSGRGARSEIWYRLVPRVVVPPTRYIGRAIDEIRPLAQAELEAALKASLEGGADGG